MKGFYRDTIRRDNGNVEQRTWCSNHISPQCSVLLSSLMKREAGLEGIQYCAYGSGLPEWDTHIPVPPVDSSALTHESGRLFLPDTVIFFIDATGTPVATPTDRLEILLEMNGDDIASEGMVVLREFGLFGGDAGETADSGRMVNHIIHPRIDLSPGMVLTRRIHLHFTETVVATAAPSGNFGRSLSVSCIDGIGEEYTQQLIDASIITIGQLADIDPLRSIGTIPPVKLYEFREKARMVIMHQSPDISLFHEIDDLSLSGILFNSEDQILESANNPALTIEIVRNLKNTIAQLQVALDDSVLQEISLGEL